jgi:two-component system nitrate/nitrite sensor histidine kinase NarX
MYQSGKQSLITRSGLSLGILVFISVLTMLVTFLAAENAENDAVRINVAGSLRMQSYRIAENLILNRSDLVVEKIPLPGLLDEFERRFYQPELSHYIRASNDLELLAAYNQLESRWLLIKRDAVDIDQDMPALLAEIDAFVLSIDELVKTLEMQTESKLKLLRSLQGISMFVTIVVVLMFLLDLGTTVVAPLRRLVNMANRIRGGDFTARIDTGRDDELALLADTLNTMSASLEETWRGLEDKVQEKTRHLEQARDELGLLYETSRLLTGAGTIRQRLDRALATVRLYFFSLPAQVELEGTEAITGLALATSHRKKNSHEAKHQHRFAIERQGEHWGDLLVSTDLAELPQSHQRTLQLVADNIATALSAESLNEQQHRLVLMEERAVIARELHDSLAQTLSYLKIQVSRLQMLQAKEATREQLDGTVDHIKQGINAAYVQLRELLSTFRLQLSSQGLHKALQATVAEFAVRGGIDIELDYRLDDFPLTPNEEIHVLQIVREALSNVLRHSAAQHARINAFVGPDHCAQVSVSDDGKGFASAQSKEHHYGKIIMRERADSLNAQIRFDNQAGGGARVVLRFVPDVIAQSRAAEK